MAQQKMAEQTILGRISAREDTQSEISMRLVGALLALAIAAVHVADQGGVTVLNSPAWLGPAWLGWAAGALLGAGPFTGYIATRTVGLPGDPGDVGNWGYWVGTVSLLAEAALVVLSVSMVLTLRRRWAQ